MAAWSLTALRVQSASLRFGPPGGKHTTANWPTHHGNTHLKEVVAITTETEYRKQFPTRYPIDQFLELFILFFAKAYQQFGGNRSDLSRGLLTLVPSDVLSWKA